MYDVRRNTTAVGEIFKGSGGSLVIEPTRVFVCPVIVAAIGFFGTVIVARSISGRI